MKNHFIEELSILEEYGVRSGRARIFFYFYTRLNIQSAKCATTADARTIEDRRWGTREYDRREESFKLI